MENVEKKPDIYYAKLINRVPYNPELFIGRQKNPTVEDFLKESEKKYGDAYGRWQTARHASNTIARPLTGFEPYFIGKQLGADTIRYELEEIGKNVTKNMKGSRMKYWNTLTGERIHMGALIDMQDRFGATLRILRAQALQVPGAKSFRDNLYAQCNSGTVSLSLDPHYSYIQEIRVPYLQCQIPSELNQPSSYPTTIDPSDPYGLMHLIGKVGHPIVRESLDKLESLERNIYLNSLY